MTLITDYRADSITIKPKGTITGEGRYPYDGTPVNTTARVINRSGMIRDGRGDEITWDREMFMAPTETVELQDKITFDSVDHEVVGKYIPRDVAGTQQYIKIKVKALG